MSKMINKQIRTECVLRICNLDACDKVRRTYTNIELISSAAARHNRCCRHRRRRRKNVIVCTIYRISVLSFKSFINRKWIMRHYYRIHIFLVVPN